MITNTGTIGFQTPTIELQPNTNNVSAVSYLVGGSPEYVLSKTPSLTSMTGGVGNQIDYTLQYQNNGTQDGTNIVLYDILPSQLSPVLPIPSGGVYNASLNRIEWILNIPVGGTGAIVYSTTINTYVATGALINSAMIDATGIDAEANENNNMATGTVSIIPTADIAILGKSIQTLGAPVSGSTTVFVIDYVNQGATGSDTFAIIDELPSIFDFAPPCTGTHAVLCSSNGSVLTGVHSALAPGETGQFVVPVVLNTQPVGTVNFTNNVHLAFTHVE